MGKTGIAGAQYSIRLNVHAKTVLHRRLHVYVGQHPEAFFLQRSDRRLNNVVNDPSTRAWIPYSADILFALPDSPDRS